MVHFQNPINTPKQTTGILGGKWYFTIFLDLLSKLYIRVLSVKASGDESG